MPHNSTRHTIARQWELLKALPARGEGKTVPELLLHLRDNGFDIQRRQVERDLDELSACFPLNHDDRNYGRRWRWIENARCNLFGMSQTEALNWQWVDQMLSRLLPDALLQELRPFFHESARVLEKSPVKPAMVRWHDKLRIIPASLPLLPPAIPEAIFTVLQQALLEERSLTITHKHPSQPLEKSLTLYPLGMIQRGPVTYLVAQAKGYSDVRLYAAHRIVAASVGTEPVTRLAGFTLDDYIAQGILHDAPPSQIDLTLRVSARKAAILSETPLTDNQRMEPDGQGGAVVRATLPQTWQLEWWLLSGADQVQVLAPQELRERIITRHREALAAYGAAMRP